MIGLGAEGSLELIPLAITAGMEGFDFVTKLPQMAGTWWIS